MPGLTKSLTKPLTQNLTNSLIGGADWSPSDISQSEADALVAFWEDTDGPNWTNKWEFAGDAGGLYGVTVGGGHVTEIDLSSNALSGVLPASAGSLDYVTSVDLSGNTLTGLDDYLVALAASVARNARTGTLDISGDNMESLTYGTEGSPSESAQAIMDLLTAGWTLTVQGDALIEEYSVSAGDTKLATRDGEAMCFDDNEDLSPHANTGRWIEFEDGSSVTAKAFIKEAGGGEDLDTERLANGNFTNWTGDDPDDWSLFGTETADTYITESAGGGEVRLVTIDGEFLYIKQSLTGSAKRIQKASVNIISTSGDPLRIRLEDAYVSISNGTGIKTMYSSVLWSTSIYVGLMSGDVGDITFDDLSLKALRDVPETGLLLVDSQNGDTRNMVDVETGFDPDDIRTIRVKDTLPEWIHTTITVEAGDCKLATEDEGAMFWIDGEDVATDFADSGCLVRFTAGDHQAEAYAGAAGGGAAYGAEISSGTLTEGKLYQITATEADHFGTGLEVDDYFTSDGTEECDANNKVKEMTDVVDTGILLTSTSGGATQSMSSIDDDFDPNAVTKIEFIGVA